MNPNDIFCPVFGMFMLTFAVWALILILRLKSIHFVKAHSNSDWVVPLFQGGSNYLTYTQRNFANLLEFPILFYVVCIVIYVTGNVDEYFITLAYSFFYIRIIHSVNHIFLNIMVPVIDVPLRAFPWLLSIAIVVWMSVRVFCMLAA